MNDGQHKPEVNDSNMTMLKDENFKKFVDIRAENDIKTAS